MYSTAKKIRLGKQNMFQEMESENGIQKSSAESLLNICFI